MGSLVRKLLLGILLVVLAACGQRAEEGSVEPGYSSAPSGAAREFVFAIHPLHNPVRLFEIYGPLVDYLNRNVPGASFRLEASRNYDEFDRKLYARHVDFALPNPYQTLNSLRYGYHVIAKMGDDHKFTGIVLVRRDSGIKQVSDLKGKKIAYPARTALAATLMPQYYLHTHGLDINRDVENLYVGSQESAIMNAYLGNVAAGVTWPLPWELFQREHPREAEELEIRWETEPMVNNGVVARDDVPAEVAGAVARLLDGLHASAEGRAILARIPLSRFELADDARYRVVGDFLRKYGQTVHPLDE